MPQSTPGDGLVSVIVPVFNTEKYLPECLNSLANQTYPALEIVIVDDGSTDASPDLCAQFAGLEPRASVIRTENRGLSAARNTGLEASHGTFVTFVDSDDYLLGDCVAEMVRAAQRSKASIVSAGCLLVTALGKPIRAVTPGQGATRPGREALLAHLRAPSIVSISAWGTLYRRSLFMDHDVRFPPGLLFEDNYASPLLYYCADRVAYIQRPYYAYRQRDESITAQPLTPKHIRDWGRAPGVATAWLRDRGFDEPSHTECYRWCVQMSLMNAVARRGTVNPGDARRVFAAIRSQRAAVLRSRLAPTRVRLLYAATLGGYGLFRILVLAADKVLRPRPSSPTEQP
ncbi:MAG: glycosyltransferase [Bifidobacteriaceae bacterium]|jgi:glycosyltransferase involved in cell wall biosynthesis|nr:glycosyltransferase [Bifidobacteriaceae bacterium]